MSDLAKRLNEQRDTLLRFKLQATGPIVNRVYSELVEASRIAADSMREAAAELARLHKLIDSLNTDYSALQSLHDAGTAPYTAEIERLQARNVELTAEVERLRVDNARLRGADYPNGCTPEGMLGIGVATDGWSDPVGKLMREHIDAAIKEAGNG